MTRGATMTARAAAAVLLALLAGCGPEAPGSPPARAATEEEGGATPSPPEGRSTEALTGDRGDDRGSPPEPVVPLLDRWTGDLDGMLERRRIRALVVPTRTQYWVDRGQQTGGEYELLKAFEREINDSRPDGPEQVAVHVVFVPTSRDDLIPALLEGRGDIAAGVLTITPERRQQVDFGTPFLRNVAEIAVTGPGSAELESVEALADREVFVRRSSSYWTHLEAASAALERQGRAPIRLRAAPEDLQDDDILEMVAAGLVDVTVVDRYAARLWAKVLPELRPQEKVVVHDGGEIAWMLRKDSPRLAAAIDAFARTHGKGSAFGNTIIRKYIGSTRFVKPATSPEELAKFQAMIELFRKYGERYRLDELLMVAQGYQESRLDQSARSSVGAIGVMQIMPATGAELAVGDITELEPNIHGGIKYVRRLIDHYYADQPMSEFTRTLFAFAAYNCGPGRMRRLRRTAAERGLDPNRWFNNVELVAAEQIGSETVTYVSNIYKYYVAYKLVEEQTSSRPGELALPGGD